MLIGYWSQQWKAFTVTRNECFECIIKLEIYEEKIITVAWWYFVFIQKWYSVRGELKKTVIITMLTTDSNGFLLSPEKKLISYFNSELVVMALSFAIDIILFHQNDEHNNS